MRVWTLNLTLSGPTNLIRDHFVDLVDRYAEIESADPPPSRLQLDALT